MNFPDAEMDVNIYSLAPRIESERAFQASVLF